MTDKPPVGGIIIQRPPEIKPEVLEETPAEYRHLLGQRVTILHPIMTNRGPAHSAGEVLRVGAHVLLLKVVTPEGDVMLRTVPWSVVVWAEQPFGGFV